jgi:hypothetical protein
MVPKKLIISCYGPADAPTTWLAMQALHDGHLTCVFDPAGKLLVARKKTQHATVDLGNWSWPGVYNCLHTANGVKPPKKLGATTGVKPPKKLGATTLWDYSPSCPAVAPAADLLRAGLLTSVSQAEVDWFTTTYGVVLPFKLFPSGGPGKLPPTGLPGWRATLKAKSRPLPRG